MRDVEPGLIDQALTPRLKNLSLRQLRYFLEVAQLHSFTRAADVLHVAQSALSRQVRMLEDELGVALFVRLDRGVTLTEAGERLRDRVAALLKDLDAIRQEVVDSQGVPRGELAVGMPPSMREMITVPLMVNYCRDFPKVLLHVNEGISIDLAKLVGDGNLDCAVVVDLMTLPHLRAIPLIKEQLYLVGPRKLRLKPTRAVTLARAADHPLILTTRPNSLRLIVDNALAAANLSANIVADSNSTSAMVEFAAEGVFSTVLPYCAAWRAIEEHRLSAAPIEELNIEWVFIHPAARALSTPALAFARALHQLARERIDKQHWLGAELSNDQELDQVGIPN